MMNIFAAIHLCLKAEIRSSFITTTVRDQRPWSSSQVTPQGRQRTAQVGFELATNCIQFYAIANLDKTYLILRRPFTTTFSTTFSFTWWINCFSETFKQFHCHARQGEVPGEQLLLSSILNSSKAARVLQHWCLPLKQFEMNVLKTSVQVVQIICYRLARIYYNLVLHT